MDQIIRIGMDTSKHVFQLHGVNAAEEPILRKKLRPGPDHLLWQAPARRVCPRSLWWLVPLGAPAAIRAIR